MKLRQYLVVASLSLLSACQGPPDAAQQSQVQQCQVCHDGRPGAAGPDIRGLDAAYLKRQLEAFAAGRRGAHPDDIQGRLMRQSSAKLEPKDFAYAADFFALQNAPVRHPTTDAVLPGAQIYTERCQRCHDSAFGRFFTSSPRIQSLEADYLHRQLSAFAVGWRVPAPGQKHEEKMRLAATQLQPDELAALVQWWRQQHR